MRPMPPLACGAPSSSLRAMIADNDMNKFPYIPPRADCFFCRPQQHLLSQLSVPGYIDADFADLEEHDEWGL